MLSLFSLYPRFSLFTTCPKILSPFSIPIKSFSISAAASDSGESPGPISGRITGDVGVQLDDTVDLGSGKLRLDTWISSRIGGTSRARVQYSIRTGHVSVNGHVIEKIPVIDICLPLKQHQVREGLPAIRFTNLELQRSESLFQFALIFSRGCPTMEVIRSHVATHWGLNHPTIIGLIDPGHVLIKLANSEDFAKAWTRDNHQMEGTLFRWFRWSWDFKLGSEAPGAPVSVSHMVRNGDKVKCAISELQPLKAEPEDIPLDIVYEDDHVLVVNKPTYMVVHPAPGNANGTLVNAILHHCSLPACSFSNQEVPSEVEDLSDGEFGCISPGQTYNELLNSNAVAACVRPGIVHRLDKGTSGLLLVAKDEHSHAHLSEQFKQHTIHRVYISLTCGAPSSSSGRVDIPIGRDMNNRIRMTAVTGPNKSRRARHAASTKS